ncbi:flagellar basal-body MS-ring/collar protein FliF [Dyella ginsengisoli]|uniref:flagellar basal-body MS-ring/collar protein FliF n=1 Tax=Dyella ginsengisoli TaxID=363848 RepID=UPI0012FE48DE|nr:flagellar basal-body MS-ring/collar protein FliF [Dyella ginsengisoli]
MTSFFENMTQRSRWMFALGVLVIIALAGFGAWWAMHPAYAPLATDLQPEASAEIGASLSQWGVPYRFEDGDKTILVPREQVYQTRMKLASDGVPRTGSVGFEAFKDSDYGVTEFAQHINYQRALQGELERTIESMIEIRSARVHLTIQHASLFDQDTQPSKASVTVALREGKTLDARQVAGIQRLLASAVEGLDASRVAVLDARGDTLSSTGDSGDAPQMDGRMAQAGKLEAAMQKQASELLARALHRTDFTVSVAVQLNYDKVKRLGNRILAQGKNGQGLLVQEKTSSSHGSGASAPGTSGGGGSSSREVEYAHGSEREEVEQAPGRIERVSVGIVVPSAVDKTTLPMLADVVSAGIGLQASRGDKVEIAMAQSVPAVLVTQPKAALEPVAKASAPVPQSHTHGALSPSFLSWLVGAAIAGALSMLLLQVVLGRRREAKRLSAPEREEVLARIRAWVEAPEQLS